MRDADDSSIFGDCNKAFALSVLVKEPTPHFIAHFGRLGHAIEFGVPLVKRVPRGVVCLGDGADGDGHGALLSDGFMQIAAAPLNCLGRPILGWI